MDKQTRMEGVLIKDYFDFFTNNNNNNKKFKIMGCSLDLQGKLLGLLDFGTFQCQTLIPPIFSPIFHSTFFIP